MLSETFGGASDELKPITMPSLGEAAILPRKRKRPGRIMSTVKALHQRRTGVWKAVSLSLSSKATRGQDWQEDSVSGSDGRTRWPSSCRRKSECVPKAP